MGYLTSGNEIVDAMGSINISETLFLLSGTGQSLRRMGNHISLRLSFWQILFIGIVLLRYGIREPDIFLGGKRNFQMIC